MIERKEGLRAALAEGFLLELLDVQGLFGGRNVLVSATGEVRIQAVHPSAGGGNLEETQYILAIVREDVERIRRALVDSDFLSLRSEERPGLPDEARPEIVLVAGGGSLAHSVAVWERCLLSPDDYLRSDRRRFDKVCRELRRLEHLAAESAEPVRAGAYTGPDSWRMFKTVDRRNHAP